MRQLLSEHAFRLTRLVGEAYEIGVRTDACRAHLLDAIARLLGANAALYIVDTALTAVVLYREPGARPFTEAEHDALSLFHLECGVLLGPSLADDVSLSPRLRDTLDGMLAGKSDKEIAIELGLTVNTAREYAKGVLRALGMKTRVELITKMLRVTRTDDAIEPAYPELGT